MASPVSKAQAAALEAAKQDVSELEPIGAGFQVCVWDETTAKWSVTPEMKANEARSYRATALAIRAIEILGHDKDEAKAAVEVIHAKKPSAARDRMLAGLSVLKGREVKVEEAKPLSDPFEALFRPFQMDLFA